MDYEQKHFETAAVEGMPPLRERRHDRQTRQAYNRVATLGKTYGISDEALRCISQQGERSLYTGIISGFREEYAGRDLDLSDIVFEIYARRQLKRWADSIREYREDEKAAAKMEGRE